MHLLSPRLLLLLDLAFCDSKGLIFKHPKIVYAWEKACVWIPCTYENRQSKVLLDKFTLYHNPEYDKAIGDFNGTVLYKKTKTEDFFSKEGRVQKSENNCTLSINPVYIQDSGKLGMRVTWRENEGAKEDKWMAELSLNVSKTPPPPQLQLFPSRIEESKPVTAICSLNFACFGYDIQLKWSLEELNSTSPSIDPSTSLSTENVFTKSKLMFQPQWTHHRKNLSCQVLHASTVLSKEMVQLDVKHRPKLKIEVNPRDAVVMKGEFVNMTCQVTSSNPEYKTISWFKDQNLMKEQQQATLTLHNVTKEMAGIYQCQASNDLGLGKSKEVNLKVLYAPEPSMVQIHPSPAEEGKSVELICVSPANPPAKNYTWHHNGNEIPEKTEEKLCISKVFLKDAGNYSCSAENVYGRGRSGQGAELDVQYPPKEVNVVIQNSTLIREGDSVKLFCRYNSSNPDVTSYSWIPGSSRNKPSGEVLWVHKVAWDTPPITCKACNHWCSESSPVSLDVQYAPRDVKILKMRPQSEILEGHQVILRCDFSQSHPKEVHFFWKKNRSLLKEGQELVFNSTSPEDAGNYSCSINNSIGQTTSKTWRLQVLYAPRRLRVSITPGDRVMEGRKAALTCESDANPPVSHYTWFDWNNQDLQYNGQTLRLESLKIKDSGSYWCQGSNRIGMGASPPSTLTVYYSPESIGRRVAIGIGSCLAIVILAIWGMKFQQHRKRAQSRQGLQDNSSSQSFFVRNKKVRRTPLSEGPHSLGCYNPVIEDSISYATLRFPETDAPRTGDAGTSEMQRPLPNSDDAVTYSVVQKRRVGDYENVVPDLAEDEGIHYSELVKFGVREQSWAHEDVEYVTLKH
ncbi:B-cell receptor CD22 [Heterocephalus glaber]|uniref:B-cell receptor CD22 n=1 Tax=Heterocephalus glaber TaxID=10181 RepID=G5BXJ2_HETGA|nr:B-cell receptor CD22 [Heterocephalus glaber]EHB14003.1 B-cell receptor CD22 [Heterocephalus glaber]